MLYPDLHEETVQPKNQLEANLWQCDDGEDASVVAYVSKMFAVPTKELPEKKPKTLTAEEMRRRGREAREARESASQAEDATGVALNNTTADEAREARESASQAEDATGVALNNTTAEETSTSQSGPADAVQEETIEETLLGFARLYSGTIHMNSSVHCVLPKYNNSLLPTHPKNTRYVLTAQVRGLYTMMGRELVPVEMVKAGNVFAISGLEGKVWRNATLCAPGGTLGATSLSDDSARHLLNLGGVNRQVSLFLETQQYIYTIFRLSLLQLSELLWSL
jgi:ribosome assembly protein 1